MKKTVLITGTSAGIGKATAELFAKNNWNVIATMRNPEKRELEDHPDITYMHLDVTDPVSIKDAINGSIKKFNKIDVLINNAGYGLRGIFESIDTDQIEKLFNTNVFGLMNVTRHILPHFRKNRSGCIINLSSIGGMAGFPLYSVYQASKFAVEGFTESLSYELEDLNIKVRLIEPGVTKTNFYTSSMDSGNSGGLTDYKEFEKVIMHNEKIQHNKGSKAVTVAKIIYKAATSKSGRLRYPVGNDARQVYTLKKLLPFNFFRLILKSTLTRKIRGNKSAH